MRDSFVSSTPQLLRIAAGFLILASLSLSQPSLASAAGVGPVPEWIWGDAFPKAKQTVWFRKSFVHTGQIQSAVLRGMADDRMTVLLNGQQVGAIAVANRFEKVDLTAKLKTGENVIAIQAENDRGAAGVLIELHIVDVDGKRHDIVSDDTWLSSLKVTDDWKAATLPAAGWSPAISMGQVSVQPWGNPIGESDDYNQWKRALGTGTAGDPSAIQVTPGFQIELLRSATKDEGSWISLTFDPRGRLILGREGKGLLRVTLPQDKSSTQQVETIDNTLLECRGLLYAFDSLYANANNSKALYRLRDTDGDDRFDEVKLLRKTEGGVGHGRNALALGPDNKIYSVHGNNVQLPTDYVAAGSPLQHFAEDRLRPCFWDRFLFDYGVKVPAGHVVRTDAEGKMWELVAGGFRNPYGIDFNADGELFTYDADNEGDIGAPWYRPSRVNQIVSGGDYGFRQGSANRPAYYPEHLPTNLDIGLGSPTGVRFGTRSHFPAPYRSALFILDWAYGRIFAVYLTPQGAGYAARAEKFIEGRPLNVTDLTFGPDGAMYFVTGGRGTQSGLYRVKYAGPAVAETLPSESETQRLTEAAAARAMRRTLEAFHGKTDAHAVAVAWPHLGSRDPWLRHAARVAIEHQPAVEWEQRALGEPDTNARLTALLALSRVGTKEIQSALLARLHGMAFAGLDPTQQLTVLRAYATSLIRMGRPDTATLKKIVQQLEPMYPANCVPVNAQLCELLAYLDAPHIVEQTMPLLVGAGTQEERLLYLYALRNVKTGWTNAYRQTYFHWLREAEGFTGGNSLPIVVNSIRTEATAWLSEAELKELAPLLALRNDGSDDSSTPVPPRPFVKDWKLEDLHATLEKAGSGRNFERGKSLYATAMCIRCHRLRTTGRPVGPELTAVGNRFNRRDLLESILVPSKVIDEKYRNLTVETKGGLVVVGRLVGGDETTIALSTEPLDPTQVKRIALDDIESQAHSPISPMPNGLLNTLTQAEILDLLAYLQSGGDPQHPSFQK